MIADPSVAESARVRGPARFSRILANPATKFGFWALVFSLACGQAPLYYSNQNQYFLRGLAAAGHGSLHDDWLANTRDPTPVFSWLVALTARFLPPATFHIY